MQAEAVDRRPLGIEQDETLARVCRSVGCVTASHDAATDDDLARDLSLGVAIAEFPYTTELAARYLEEGIDVVLGAPNLVRGTSHLGHLSVRDAVVAGAVTMLCSDYHYPSLLRAPFVMAELGLSTLAEAWELVSAAPARAAGLGDRGVLARGRRADIIVVEPPGDGFGPRVRSVIVNGELVFHVGASSGPMPDPVLDRSSVGSGASVAEA